MHKQVLIALLIILSLFGIADSWYMAQTKANQDPLVCNIDGLDGCNVVAQSQYSEFMGVPLAVYGVGFYAVIFLITMMLSFFPSRLGYEAMIVLGIAGALASLVFLIIQLAVIKAICIYCVASAVTSFLYCGLSIWLFKRFAPPRLAVIG